MRCTTYYHAFGGSFLQQSRTPAPGHTLRIRRLPALAEHDTHGMLRAVVRDGAPDYP